jgi:peptide/nickel transport system permease protein
MTETLHRTATLDDERRILPPLEAGSAEATAFATLGLAGLEDTAPESAARRRRPLWLRAGVVASALFLLLLAIAALFPSVVATHDPLAITLGAILKPLSADHLLGTDDVGRDVFSRLVYGARASLIMGLGATLVGLAGGIAIGLLAGLGNRLTDSVFMRFVDCLVAVPDILLALIVITVAGGGTVNAMIAVGLASIPNYARIIRAQAHLVRVSPYIESARTLGLSRLQVAVRHVLPNAFRPIIPLAALRIGGAIGAGAGLSFLGLGAQPPEAEWGAMIASGRNFLANDPMLVIWPALAITLTVLAIGVLARELKQRIEGRVSA